MYQFFFKNNLTGKRLSIGFHWVWSLILALTCIWFLVQARFRRFSSGPWFSLMHLKLGFFHISVSGCFEASLKFNAFALLGFARLSAECYRYKYKNYFVLFVSSLSLFELYQVQNQAKNLYLCSIVCPIHMITRLFHY